MIDTIGADLTEERPFWSAAAESRDGFPAGPRYWTPLGMTAAFRRDPLGLYREAFRTFGDVVGFRVGPFRSLLIAHPDHIKHVLQDNNHNYVKGIVIAKLKVLIGEGLFTSEGDFWRRQRRLAQPAFHRQRLAGFVTTMTDATRAMLDRWEPVARSGEPFDVAAEMSRLTLGIVGRTLFSRNLDDAADEVGRTLGEVLALMNDRAMRFLPSPLWWPTAFNRRLARGIRGLDRVVFDIIERRRRTARHTRGPARHADARARRGDGRGHDRPPAARRGHDVRARRPRDDGGRAHLDVVPARPPSGRSPSALRAEVAAALGGRARRRWRTCLASSYARMVVEEAMRLYPPVWGFFRQALGPDRLGEHVVPKGAVILISPYVTHRHPRVWDDPERFDPERFAPERVRERPRFAYLPFSGGPRLCIGNEFALMEAQLAVAMTVQRYRLRLVPGARVEPESRLTLRPRGGMAMTLEAA